MLFSDLDELIPSVPADKDNLHVHTMYIAGGYGWSVRVRWPGKHHQSSGDFVVETLSEGVWDDYFQFKHSDLFEDVVLKWEHDHNAVVEWLPHMLDVVQDKVRPERTYPTECRLPGIHLDALTNSLQALTVCEWRRFPQGDVRGGGRYLPINYMMAILQGFWDVEEASNKMRRGFPALRDLDGFTPFRHSSHGANYIKSRFDDDS